MTRSRSASAPSPLCVEVTARHAVARGLGSRRRLHGVGWLEAGRRRTRARGAIIARSARFSFSRFAWSPLERQDTADGGPLSPLFCLWVSVTEGPVVPVRETSTRNRRRNGVDERVGGSAREGVFARCQLRQVERWPRGAATRPAICLPVGALRSGGGAAGEGKSAVALSHDGRMGCFSLASIIDGPTGFGTGRRRHDRRRRYRRVDETQSEGPHQLALF